ncbi:hypothetical protein IFM89_033480 [Coptis chinensis]|uniref:Phosducin domain-containing protein n=1 Tax=Coptis chinensis TaxID=261450 RepID=A0A835I1C3_9MAGN|nr:hypothetical protein IFM89_033480 [Coptis chinensis]
MGDYHFVYKDLEGTSTQWDDIQTKLGNLPPKPPVFKPPTFTPEDSKPKDKSWIHNKTEDELEDLEDDTNLDDDRFLEEYRKKRLAEIKEATKVSRFGSVIPISGVDFVREVSQAESDVWVVVFLYKEGIAECGVVLNCLEELATKYPVTKFVKIVSTDCIQNYPDRNLPTLLVYNNGAVKATYVGMHHFGRRCTPEASGVDPILAMSSLGLRFRSTVTEFFEKPPVVIQAVFSFRDLDLERLIPFLSLPAIPELPASTGAASSLVISAGASLTIRLSNYHSLRASPSVCKIELYFINQLAYRLDWSEASRRSSGVALALCQSDPVLNDGQSGSDVIEGVRKRFIEKVVAQHEDDEDAYFSD